MFASPDPVLTKILHKLWQRSIYVSCIAYVLAEETGKIRPDEALLAGLISEIGAIPLINFAAKCPSNYFSKEELLQSLPVVRGAVGAYILRCWDFPEELIRIPLLADDWFQYESENLTLADVVVLSRLHSKIGTSEISRLPAITSIPAAAKLNTLKLSPEHSLQILHDAKDRIYHAMRDFSV